MQWCHANDYGITVADDLAAVDLDWWNTHLESYRIPVRLWGRTIDANPNRYRCRVSAAQRHQRITAR